MSPATYSSCTAIIVAAGSSRRMGFDKLSASLKDKPVLCHTLEAFLAAESITSLVVVCPSDRWNLLQNVDFTKPVIRCDGGETRQESVSNGLKITPACCAFVAVHDGARPIVSPDDIDRAVATAMDYQAATLARRSTETMKRSDTENFCTAAVDRENLWCIETPQVFAIELLTLAYQHVNEQGLNITDEVSALQAIRAKVKFVESRHPNLKITTPADLALAEALLQ